MRDLNQIEDHLDAISYDLEMEGKYYGQNLLQDPDMEDLEAINAQLKGLAGIVGELLYEIRRLRNG